MSKFHLKRTNTLNSADLVRVESVIPYDELLEFEFTAEKREDASVRIRSLPMNGRPEPAVQLSQISRLHIFQRQSMFRILGPNSVVIGEGKSSTVEIIVTIELGASKFDFIPGWLTVDSDTPPHGYCTFDAFSILIYPIMITDGRFQLSECRYEIDPDYKIGPTSESGKLEVLPPYNLRRYTKFVFTSCHGNVHL